MPGIGPIVAVWLYRRLDGVVTLRQAMLIGLLAGAWHGLFGLLLSPLGLAGAGGLFNELSPFMSAQDLPDLESALTGVGGLLFNLVGIFIDLVFGFLGGLIGAGLGTSIGFGTDSLATGIGVGIGVGLAFMMALIGPKQKS